jgi:hypothetical protein
MDISVDFLVLIALSLFVILALGAALVTVFTDGGSQVKGSGTNSRGQLDCVTKNPGSAGDCVRNEGSAELMFYALT